MNCPAWDQCPKTDCNEENRCTNLDYWARYWQNQKELKTPLWKNRQKHKKDRRILLRTEYRSKFPPCVKTGDWCNKKDACTILGQCIIEHPRIAGKNHFINALKGELDVVAIVKILRLHDPLAFDNYYPKKKNKV